MNNKEVVNIDAALALLEMNRKGSSPKKLKERITMIGIELEGGWVNPPGGPSTVIRDGSVRGLSLPAAAGGPAAPVGPFNPVARQALIQERFSQIIAGRGQISARAHAQILREVTTIIDREIAQGTVQSARVGGLGLAAVGEIPSPVMPPSELVTWMRKYYPDTVNETCGLHVHMSFKSALHYQRLMIPSYQATILAYVTAWAKGEKLPDSHPIWPRLLGQSRYCQHKFWPEHQIKQRGKEYDQQREGHRYTVINFCYSANGTVECRLLPMMEEREQGIRAVQTILDITNAFLSSGKGVEKKFNSSTVAAEEAFTETRQVHLTQERRSSEIRA